jgi:hypothetical protein
MAKIRIIELDASRPPWRVDARGCWIATAGYREKHGYRMFKLLGRRIRAHRLAFRATKGPIPVGMVVRHSCDNCECINPAHLLLGTRKDNSQDMVDRGRVSHWQDRPGSQGHRLRRKLTLQQIGEIRLSQEGSYPLSERYAVSAVQIRRIRNGSRCKGL